MIISNARLGHDQVDIRIENGVITEIAAIGTGDIDLAGRWISPGLWDHHDGIGVASREDRNNVGLLA